MAFTGIASTLLIGGRTIHNRFALPVPMYSDSNSGIKRGTIAAEEIIETEVFIIDEAVVAPKYAFQIIDKKLRELHKNQTPFAGKTIILGGDFRQILPVQDKATDAQLMDLSIKRSTLWKYFRHHKLTQNMRTDSDQMEFAEYLLKIGCGSENDEDEKVSIKDELICENLEERVFKQCIDEKNFR